LKPAVSISEPVVQARVTPPALGWAVKEAMVTTVTVAGLTPMPQKVFPMGVLKVEGVPPAMETWPSAVGVV